MQELIEHIESQIKLYSGTDTLYLFLRKEEATQLLEILKTLDNNNSWQEQ